MAWRRFHGACVLVISRVAVLQTGINCAFFGRSADYPEGIHGKKDSAGLRIRGPAGYHEIRGNLRQPSLPRVAAFRQHSLSQVLDPEKQRPGFRMETLSEQQAVCDGARLHRQRPAHVPGETCAWCAMKTVGPPYSGKLNVRWDGKGMVTRS